MALELVLVTSSLDSSVTSCLRESQLHWLFEEWKGLNLFNCFRGAVDTIKNYKCLAFCLEVGLCDYIDDLAILREDFAESFFEGVNFDGFLEVARINSEYKLAEYGTCRSAMTRT